MKSNIIIVVLVATLGIVSCKNNGPGQSGTCDSNAIVGRYLESHHLLESRSFFPVLYPNNKGQNKELFLKKIRAGEFNFYDRTAIQFRPNVDYFGQGDGTAIDPNDDGTIHTYKMATATAANYTILISLDTAKTIVRAFQDYYQSNQSERFAFFIKAQEIEDYLSKSHAKNLELMPALYQDQTNLHYYRTFVMVACDSNSRQMAGPGNKVYEHLLPCPDECTPSNNSLISSNM